MTQLNVDHTTENEDELFRLSQLGAWGRGRRPVLGGQPRGSPLPSAVVMWQVDGL